MRRLVLFFALGFMLASCTDNEWYFEGNPDGDDSDIIANGTQLEAQRVTVYDQAGNESTATFTYQAGKLTSNDKYEYKEVGNTLEIYEINATTPSFIASFDEENELKRFESAEGAYFEITNRTTNYDITSAEAKWKQCASCEELSVNFEKTSGQNFRFIEAYNASGVEIFSERFNYDHKPNPFFRNFHLPELFLTDLEYFVQTLSCNNIVASTNHIYRYAYDNRSYPVSIYKRKTERSATEVLTKEVAY